MATFKSFYNEPDGTPDGKPVYIIGSPMCGSPISVRLLPSQGLGGTMQKLVLTVIVEKLDGQETSFEFTTVVDQTAVKETDTIDFDISSAIRAVFDEYRYTSEPPSKGYPTINFRLEAKDVYMDNGVQKETQTTYYPVEHIKTDPATGEVLKDGEGKDDIELSFLHALNGRYTDLERLLAGYKKLAYDFSRKPKDSPQIVTVGEQFVYPNSFTGREATVPDAATVPNASASGREATVPDASPSAPSATVPDASASVPFQGYYLDDLPCGPTSEVTDITFEGEQQIGDITVYALPEDYRNRDRYEFRFINSLGCMESYSLTCLSEEEMAVKKQNYTLATIENFGDFSHGVMQKSDDKETIKLTSGPLTPDWADWFAHEFLMAKHCWLNLYPQTGTELWVRCHLDPGETLKISNRKTDNPYDIPFTVSLDITGTLNTNITV